MGIFSYINNKKKELRDLKTQQRKDQYEQDKLELKYLREEKKKLELRNTVKNEKKALKQLQHPILSSIGKTLKSNLEKNKKTPNMFQQALQKDANNITSMFSSGPSKPNPLFSSTGSGNIFNPMASKKKPKKDKNKSITIRF